MRIVVLLATFILSVVVMTAAWWLMIIPQASNALWLCVCVLVILIAQLFGWNLLCEFPSNQAVKWFLGAGFPVAATLMAVAFGSFVLVLCVDRFFVNGGRSNQENERVLWGSAMVAGNVGLPAFVVGVLLLLACSACWLLVKRR